MARKYILDSLKFWVREYGVDGFRFDLMALIDLDTMKQAETELRAIRPDIVLYGEPWGGGGKQGFFSHGPDLPCAHEGELVKDWYTDQPLRWSALGTSTSAAEGWPCCLVPRSPQDRIRPFPPPVFSRRSLR